MKRKVSCPWPFFEKCIGGLGQTEYPLRVIEGDGGFPLVRTVLMSVAIGVLVNEIRHA